MLSGKLLKKFSKWLMKQLLKEIQEKLLDEFLGILGTSGKIPGKFWNNFLRITPEEILGRIFELQEKLVENLLKKWNY